MIKSKINTELAKLKSIKSEAELYWIFFRLIQVTSTAGLILFLIFSVSLMLQGALGGDLGLLMSPQLITVPLLLGISQIIIAEMALRAVRRKEFWATLVGLVMSLYIFPSYLLPLACFGFYSFLNPGFQREYLVDSPEWFKNLLTNLRLNKMETVDVFTTKQ